LRAPQSIIRLIPRSRDETRALVGNLFGLVIGHLFAQVQDFVATRAGGNTLGPCARGSRICWR